MSMVEAVIQVRELGKRYRLGGGAGTQRTLPEAIAETARRLVGRTPAVETPADFWALRDVSFDIHRGEVVGIVGGNGAGKSTLLKVLAEITEPTTGRAAIAGRVASLLEVGTGFHPELTGRENIYLNGSILGLTRREIKHRFDDIVEFSGVEAFLDTPIKRYSSGMSVRLAFAVAAHLEPEILIVDEVLAVGDAAFQDRCLGKMQQVARGGRTVLLVSHNMGAIQQLCDRALLIRQGRLALDGEPREVVKAYLEDGAVRQGERQLEVVGGGLGLHAVRLVNDEEHRGFNEPLTFELDLHADRAMPQAHVGLGIANSTGARVTTAAMSAALPQGDWRLRITLDTPRLPPGRYHLSVGIDSFGKTVIFQDRVLMFDLSEAGTPDAYLVRKRDRIGVFAAARCERLEWQRHALLEAAA